MSGLLGLFATACVETVAPTEVLVQIDSDAQLLESMRKLHVEVWSSAADCGGDDCWSERLDRDFGSATQVWPVRFPILPLAGDDTRVFEIIARALDASGQVLVEQRAVSGFVPGRRAGVTLAFETTCLPKAGMCEPTGECHGEACETCRKGACEPVGKYQPTPDGALTLVSPGEVTEPDAGLDASSDQDTATEEEDGDAAADSAPDPDAGEAGAAGPCEGDGWDHDSDASTPCVARTPCAAGQYVTTQPDATHDRACGACASGSYSSESNADSCALWRDCDPGNYVSNTPSDMQDRTCLPCGPGEVASLPNQSSCLPERSCPAGEHEVMPGTLTSQPMCDPCSAGEFCPGGATAPVACSGETWDHDSMPSTACAAHRRCLAGQRVSKAGTSLSDRECAACTTGTFSATDNASMCTPWTPCPVGYQEGAPGSAVADRTCVIAPWFRQFGSSNEEYSDQSVTDANGNLYIVGRTFGAIMGQTGLGSIDVFVRKYNNVGTEQWTRQFGTSAQDQGNSISVDAAGNVYIAGLTEGTLPGQGALGGLDAFVRKYDGAGTEQWTRQFGTASSDYGYAVTAEASGAVYVAGYTEGAFTGFTNPGGFGEFLRKYDAAGNVVWTRQFSVGSFGFSPGGNLSADASGNVYLAGLTKAALPAQVQTGSTDPYVRKYDASGAELWTRQFGTSSGAEVHAIGVDSSGSVYLAGHVNGALPSQGSAGSADAFVRKYNTQGTEQWTRQFGTASWDQLNAVRTSGTSVFVAGYTAGALPNQTSSGQSDLFIRRYDGGGNEAWTRQLGTSSGDLATGVGVDSAGYVYASGRTNGVFPGQTAVGGTDIFALKLVP